MKLPAIERPNGKSYRPRSLRSRILGNEDEITGVVVFGTHDVYTASSVARLDVRAAVNEWGWDDLDYTYVVDEVSARRVWWRQDLSHFEDNEPHYTYTPDDDRGFAGVVFDVIWESKETCPACDAPLSLCSPDAACCTDCSHVANWPNPAPLFEVTGSADSGTGKML